MSEWRDINDPPPRDRYGVTKDWDGALIYTTEWVLCSVRSSPGYAIGRAMVNHATGKVVRWQSLPDTVGAVTHWQPLPAKPAPWQPLPVKDKS